jgi:hypothetical protein
MASVAAATLIMATEAAVATAAAATAAVTAAPLLYGSAAIGLGAGISTARAQRADGKTQEAEFKRAAEQEKIAAVDREGQRRRRLNEVLGSSIAETGARGIKFEGSPQARAKGVIGQAELAQSGAKVTDLSRIAQLKRSGVSARITGKNRSTGTLLNTATQTAGTFI